MHKREIALYVEEYKVVWIIINKAQAVGFI